MPLSARHQDRYSDLEQTNTEQVIQRLVQFERSADADLHSCVISAVTVDRSRLVGTVRAMTVNPTLHNMYDVIFAGGGLTSTLVAYRLKQTRPDLRVLVLEAGQTLGGNHTWSFHTTDISPEAYEWVKPFIAHSWPQQRVHFPKFSRLLPLGYNTIFSETLHKAAMTLLADSVQFSVKVKGLGEDSVTLEDGRIFTAACVIDARGQGETSPLTVGYQKFVGVEVRLENPHGEEYPVIMDATIPQRDGYRFIYTLPFAADRLLIEDTYYSDSANLDVARLERECLGYAERRGWKVAEVLRVEKGVLPIVLSGNAEMLSKDQRRGVPVLGVRAGFFNYTTSYSFPFAIRCAEAIASMNSLSSASLDVAVRGWAESHWRDQRFFRLLNRMLFWAAVPDQRYKVMERFYKLGQPLIERFYGSNLTFRDRARILAGWPPVPVSRALRVLGETSVNPIPQPAAPASRST